MIVSIRSLAFAQSSSGFHKVLIFRRVCFCIVYSGLFNSFPISESVFNCAEIICRPASCRLPLLGKGWGRTLMMKPIIPRPGHPKICRQIRLARANTHTISSKQAMIIDTSTHVDDNIFPTHTNAANSSETQVNIPLSNPLLINNNSSTY